MATASLNASPRSDKGKGVARKLRASGKVPGVIYGHGREPQSLTVDAREFDRLAERVRITSTVIELALDGRTARTLIRELQRDPIRRHVLHIDFQELVAGEKVTVSVPIRFLGTPEGVKTGGGILEEIIHQLDVRCDPANIPDHIDVDVTALTIGHGLHVADLKLPEGVEVMAEAEQTVAIVSAPKAEETATPAAEGAAAAPEAAAEPELIRKPKAGDEEGEAEES
ncbi:MAG TPA: 50S ribosomal protein L25/general stress protein Ctc [Gemmatimonadaceae bacterium]|nr:50S ribosomal protein L25/general stress protein Ctc [Gemmatimonadaceae bacterium]